MLSTREEVKEALKYAHGSKILFWVAEAYASGLLVEAATQLDRQKVERKVIIAVEGCQGVVPSEQYPMIKKITEALCAAYKKGDLA